MEKTLMCGNKRIVVAAMLIEFDIGMSKNIASLLGWQLLI
jgi:hypothetical protein